MRKLGLYPLLLFLSLLGIFFLFLPSLVLAQESSEARERLLVQFRPALSLEERLKFQILEVIKGQAESTLEKLSRDPMVVYAEPDYKAFALELTNDPGIVNNLQWGMFKI